MLIILKSLLPSVATLLVSKQNIELALSNSLCSPPHILQYETYSAQISMMKIFLANVKYIQHNPKHPLITNTGSKVCRSCFANLANFS